jgi:hypothetical protein
VSGAGFGGSRDHRVADVERRAATLVKTKRNTWRGRHERKSDMPPVRASNGDAVQCDAKSRRAGLPQWIVAGLAECRAYSPDAIPCLLVYPLGGEAVAILPAAALARLAGIRPPEPGEQLVLASRGAK